MEWAVGRWKGVMLIVYIIDRFEGDWAVIEGPGRVMFNLPRELLPREAKPGDVLSITVRINRTGTKERTEKARALLENFFDE